MKIAFFFFLGKTALTGDIVSSDLVFFVDGCVFCAARGVTTSIVPQGWQVRADMLV